jgi:uncharacterized metal-binding protein YceD (DUF177 family)
MSNLEELEVKPMEDAKVRVIESKLSNGTVVTWHVMTGVDEEKLGMRKDIENDKITAAHMARIDKIDGLPATKEAVKNLSFRVRTELKDLYEKYEGGVETEQDLQCSKCGHEFRKEIEIGQVGFFFPSRGQNN